MLYCSSIIAFLNTCQVPFKAAVLWEWKERWFTTCLGFTNVSYKFPEKGFVCFYSFSFVIYFFFLLRCSPLIHTFTFPPQIMTHMISTTFPVGCFKNSFTPCTLFVCLSSMKMPSYKKRGENPCPEKKNLFLMADLSCLSNFRCTQHCIMPSVVLLTIARPRSL